MLLLRVTSIAKVINLIAFLPLKVLYNPKAFFTRGMAASGLRPLYSPAASRRSLDRVSVPVWLVILSDQLGIVA